MKKFWDWLKSLFPAPKVLVKLPDEIENIELPTATPAEPGPATWPVVLSRSNFARGVDISHHQTDVDWDKLETEVDFVIHKGTQGVNYIDDKYLIRRAAAEKRSMLFGTYHWLEPHGSGVAQAKDCIRLCGLKKGDLVFCDIEDDDKKTAKTADILKIAKDFLKYIEEYTDRVPVIYTGKWFMDQIKTADPELKNYPLWIAHYTATAPQPTLPKPWTTWKFWQVTDKAKNYGITSVLSDNGGDFNYFNGTWADLQKFWAYRPSGALPPTTPTKPETTPEPSEVLSVRKENFRKVAESLGYGKQSAYLLKLWARMYPNANPQFYALFDVGLPDSRRRFFVIDADKASVQPLSAAHGSGSDKNNDDVADKFSNTPGSLMTSLGAYRCAETYTGKNGRSLKLDGLESTNSNARSRAVVIHQAQYVKDGGLVGRSSGCPALDPKYAQKVIDELTGGSPLYIFQS